MTPRTALLLRISLIPPVWGAAAFALCSTVYTVGRPGAWYFPVIHEAFAFALSFLPCVALNVLAFAPLAWALTSLTRHVAAAVPYVVVMAAATAVAAHWGEWLGHKPTLFHRAYLYGVIVPAMVMATSAWWMVVRARRGQ